MATIDLHLPLDEEKVNSLHAGDSVRLYGSLYTGRDAAHKRLVELVSRGEPLPIPLQGETIYYVGPAPAKPGQAVGPAGPTSSYRMDAYTPPLLKLGLRGMIGKGLRGPDVVDAMRLYGAVYFGAVGGAAALIAHAIKESQVVAYPDLGTEAIHRFRVEGMPVLVLIDRWGNNLYENGPKLYKSIDL